MSEIKNARPVAATTEQAAEFGTAKRAVTFSNFDCTTAGKRKSTIFNLLHAGAKNALTLRELVQITGLDGRAVRNMIAAERRAGAAILSDNTSGYFLPSDAEEKARFVRSMRHRAGEIMRAADAVEKSN